MSRFIYENPHLYKDYRPNLKKKDNSWLKMLNIQYIDFYHYFCRFGR